MVRSLDVVGKGRGPRRLGVDAVVRRGSGRGRVGAPGPHLLLLLLRWLLALLLLLLLPLLRRRRLLLLLLL